MKKYGLKFRIFLVSGVSIMLLAFGIIMFFSSSKPAVRPNEKTQTNLKELEALGFTKVKNLNLGDDYDAMVNMEKTKYYWDKYELRYLSETGLHKLMDEFNFVIGTAGDFSGTIPEKNIEELKINLKKIISVSETCNFYFNGSNDENTPMIDYVEQENITPEGKQLAINNYNHPSFHPAWLGNCVFNDHYNSDPKYPRIPLVLHYTPTPIKTFASLHIVAPKDFFDLKDKDIVDRIINTIRPPKDPMIITRVKDGYVVLTQW